jgi:hypothetical protein
MNRVLRPLTCLILLAALPGLALAGDHGRGPPPQAPMRQAPPPSPPPPVHRDVQPDPSALPDSVRRVERSTGGEVLRAEPMQRDGREVYRMKVLTADGRIRVVQDDPHKRAPEPRQGARIDRGADPADEQDSDPPPPEEE